MRITMTPQTNAERIAEQYLTCQEDFDKGLPEIVKHRKIKAVKALKLFGLPTKKLEDYKRSDIDALFDKPIILSSSDEEEVLSGCSSSSKLFDKYTIPSLEVFQATFFNDRVCTADNIGLPQGVFIGSLKDFLKQNPNKEDEIAFYYGRIAKSSNDGMVALNTIFVKDVFLLYLPKGISIEKPLHLIQVMQASSDLYASTRFLILLEEDSHASIILSDHMGSEHQYTTNRVIEIAVGKRAQLELYDLEQSKGRNHKLSTVVSHQAEESKVTIGEYTLGNGFTRNNYRARFLGERAKLKLNGLVVGHKDCHIDNYTRVEHTVPECHTDELFKYLLKDNAVGSFMGRIFISQGAQKTLAYQQDRNLLLSPDARAYAKPFLEIYADDVHCSHGMTTGQLDEDALFYMRQRGIPDEEARVMLSIAFAKDVLERIEIPILKDLILEIVERDFYGGQYDDKKTFFEGDSFPVQ